MSFHKIKLCKQDRFEGKKKKYFIRKSDTSGKKKKKKHQHQTLFPDPRALRH